MKLFLCILISVTAGFGQTPHDIVLRIESRLHSYETLQAEFEQFYFSSTVSAPLHEKGRLYFEKPDTMKWEYREPEEKLFLIKDGILWDYNKEEGQLIKYSLEGEDQNYEVIALLSGQINLLDTYDVQYSPFPTENDHSKQLRLTPKNEEYADSFLLLEIDERSWFILKIISFDWTGNKTEFRFQKYRTNVSFPEGTFDLKIPPGTEIIDNQEIRRR